MWICHSWPCDMSGDMWNYHSVTTEMSVEMWNCHSWPLPVIRNVRFVFLNHVDGNSNAKLTILYHDDVSSTCENYHSWPLHINRHVKLSFLTTEMSVVMWNCHFLTTTCHYQCDIAILDHWDVSRQCEIAILDHDDVSRNVKLPFLTIRCQ